MAARRPRFSAAAGGGQEHRGCAEGMVVRSSPGDVTDCTCLRLVCAVSAWSASPHGMGAKRDRQSTCRPRTGAAAAEAGEARESSRRRNGSPPASSCLPLQARESQPLWCTSKQGYVSRKLHLVRAVGHPHILRWRTAKQPELQQKEVSELAKSPDSAESKSCMSCSSFLAALTSAQQPIAPGADRLTLFPDGPTSVALGPTAEVAQGQREHRGP
ncbi:uncharacterized protein LOC142043564 [Buteo buteo]|uniref:uncharacterized protein LOC142043564 n=1 Tax=Buteo buteo TaxID=30397 RepID=UPI003EB747A4